MPSAPGPELWAGIECTVNRVGDSFHDQCRKNGHAGRISDLALFRDLGIRRLRYPFLWETAAAYGGELDWRWADERTAELERLGLTPIAGLLHHGSGPAHTSLLDPSFPEKFAAYAEAFARRYPWIKDYTPINEPLTTARFGALYGFWYPHAKSDRDFLRALYHQIRATVLAMRAIREVQPGARLVQTEDLGRATGTELLAYQVDFENERRWLTYDLLRGEVNEQHSLYGYLTSNGLTAAELIWLTENPCPPDVIGINHYLLSNRFLDHELEHYPPHFHGGNHRHRYADVGAIDSPRARPPLPKEIFREAWERYGQTIAVTEVHLNGPRESQLRWFREIWDAASELKQEGADILAVTAWSLIGSYDWNSLCTREENFYETGVFDCRLAKPRPTALARMLESLARTGEFSHPLFARGGYWNAGSHPELERPLLITGATGNLGGAFARLCRERGIPFVLLGRGQMDIAAQSEVNRALESLSPWAVVNAAGYARVDQAEAEQEKCYRENVLGPEILARATALHGIALLCFSTHMVFDGELESPYRESDRISPLNFYGRSKAESEEKVLTANPRALVIRTSSLFGPWSDRNFVGLLLARLKSGEKVPLASDITLSPTYLPDLVHACLDLLIDGENGIVHLTNRGAATLADFGRRALAHAQETFRTVPFPGEIVGSPATELRRPARRPRFSVLGTERHAPLATLEDALGRYFRDSEIYKSKMEERV